MKQIHITGSLIKGLALCCLLTACNHDDLINPTENTGIATNDQNAKISPLNRLIKDGNWNLQYIKNGKFLGKISKVYTNGYYSEYTYDNNNPAGDLFITQKSYSTSNSELVGSFKYQVANGICVASEDMKHGYLYQYKYTVHNLLDEVQISGGGSDKVETRKYFYAPSGATDGFRLYKVTTNIIESGKIVSNKECTITYHAIPDKYPTNPGHTGVDRFLPIFGKFSDLLVKDVYETGFSYNIPQQSLAKYTYSINADGLATSRTLEYACTDNPSPVSSSAILKYSVNWQGI